MNLALLILQYFLFSFILFCIRVSALIYRYRQSIIQHEFQFSQITYLLIWAVRWVVLPLTFLGIISEIVTTQNFWLIIVLIAISMRLNLLTWLQESRLMITAIIFLIKRASYSLLVFSLIAIALLQHLQKNLKGLTLLSISISL